MSRMSERALTLQASVEIFNTEKGCPACSCTAFACLIALPGILVCQDCGCFFGLTTEQSARELVSGGWAGGLVTCFQLCR